MIIDSHAHVFPYLGGASGYDSIKTHMRYLQRHLVDRIGVVERKGELSRPMRISIFV